MAKWKRAKRKSIRYMKDIYVGGVANLATNPDFESATTGWFPSGNGTIARDTTDAQFGVACGKLTRTDGNEVRLQTNVAIAGPTAGRRFTVSVYIKCNADSSGSSIKLRLQDTGGAAAAGLQDSSPVTIVTAEGWKRFTFSPTALTENDRTELQWRIVWAAFTSGTFLFLDGFQVEESAYAHNFNRAGRSSMRSSRRGGVTVSRSGDK